MVVLDAMQCVGHHGIL